MGRVQVDILAVVVTCIFLLDCLPSVTARGCGGRARRRSTQIGDPTPYCHGDYEINEQHCGIFGFHKGDEKVCNKRNYTDVNPVLPVSRGYRVLRRIEPPVMENWKSVFISVFMTTSGAWFELGTEKVPLPDEHTTKMIELISNVFENGDTIMGYGYIENLGDGRGFTSGYLGFCTGTGDAYAAVSEYQDREPDNILGQYLPRMKQLANSGSGSTSGLGQYKSNWVKAACGDPVFVQTQLDVGRSMNLKPALKYATAHGVKSNLGKAIFYDTVIEQGIDCDTSTGDISIDRLLKLLGSKNDNESEQEYLARFLKMRRQMLCCFPDDVWPESADRVSDLQNLVENWSENSDLANPVQLVAYTTTVTGNEQTAYDTENCHSSRVPSGWKLPAPTDLPIPNLC